MSTRCNNTCANGSLIISRRAQGWTEALGFFCLLHVRVSLTPSLFGDSYLFSRYSVCVKLQWRRFSYAIYTHHHKLRVTDTTVTTSFLSFSSPSSPFLYQAPKTSSTLLWDFGWFCPRVFALPFSHLFGCDCDNEGREAGRRVIPQTLPVTRSRRRKEDEDERGGAP